MTKENAMSQALVDMINMINQNPPGWLRALDLVIIAASADEVTAEWTVSEKHHQGYGIVHGGVHSSVIETLASLGAAIAEIGRAHV